MTDLLGQVEIRLHDLLDVLQVSREHDEYSSYEPNLGVRPAYLREDGSVGDIGSRRRLWQERLALDSHDC